MRRWASLGIALALAGAAACGSDTDGASSTTDVSTTVAESTPASDPEGPTAPPEPETVDIDELSRLLDEAVESGRLCALSEVFTQVSPDLSSDDNKEKLQRMVDQALVDLLPVAPDEIVGAVTTIAEESSKANSVLDENGGDRADPEFAKYADSPEINQAYLDYREWIGANCDLG